MATIPVKKNEATAARRRVYFHCVDATDGMSPETGEAGGQPQISVDGASWTNTGIGVLSAIGNGRYYADLTQTVTNVDDAVICTRYKSANTAECVGDTVVIDSRLDLIPNFATDEDIADAVLDEALSGHSDPGSVGEAIAEAAGAASPDELTKLYYLSTYSLTKTDNGNGTYTISLKNGLTTVATRLYTEASDSFGPWEWS